MARVQVDDVTWSEFRASLGATPASVALSKLVEREVAASRRRSAPDDAAVLWQSTKPAASQPSCGI
jgi:hypothetical protein